MIFEGLTAAKELLCVVIPPEIRRQEALFLQLRKYRGNFTRYNGRCYKVRTPYVYSNYAGELHEGDTVLADAIRIQRL